MAKIPGTPAPPKELQAPPLEVPVEPMLPPVPPLEIVVHQAGVGVRKVQTPEGNLTIVQVMTPIGIMFSLKFDDAGVDYLVKDLTGTSGLVVPPSIVVPR